MNLRQPSTRLQTIYANVGELWYFRLLLRSFPCRSESDLRTVDGVVYNSFQQAAKAAGLLDQMNEGEIVLRESLLTCTPSQLRQVFAVVTLQGHATMHILTARDQNPVYIGMTADYRTRPHLSSSEASSEQTQQMIHTLLLTDLEYMLRDENTSLRTFGINIESLPIQSEYTRELSRYVLVTDMNTCRTTGWYTGTIPHHKRDGWNHRIRRQKNNSKLLT